MIATNLNSQIIRNCFSVKLNYGMTFLSPDELSSSEFTKKNIRSICPGIAFNFLLPKEDILELGIVMYDYGGVVKTNLGGSAHEFGAGYYIYAGQIVFHKKLSVIGKKILLGIGSTFIRQGLTGLSYRDTFKSMIVQTCPGTKILGNISCKYFVNIRKRVFAIDFIYTKGFFNLMELKGVDNSSQLENRYKNLGSGIHLGISYYFRKHNNKTNL